MNLFYEDIEIGASFTTPTHLITETDIADFCRLTRDRHPLHTDADIDHLVGALHSLWSRCALARAVA